MVLKLTPGERLVAATHNPGKARELAALLDGRFQIISAGELGLPEPNEVEQTFMGNAVLKARSAADLSKTIAIADDSGFSLSALDGAPGVLSARWAGPDRDFALAMAKVEERLNETGSEDRGAWFTCALAVAWPSGPVVVVEGTARGEVVFPPRGDKGFGYDPIFVPSGERLTFGEMHPARKDQISHRAMAFAKLKAALF
jgi:XTP/dITP diphosphohydrolase